MTPRETVIRTIRFQGADRIPWSFPEAYGTDFARVGHSPSPDDRPPNGRDEWGAVWRNIGGSSLGQVQDAPLKDWSDWPDFPIPDITEPRRWRRLEGARARAGDRFLLAGGISIYERLHFVRGLENTWADIHLAPDKLGRLIDVLVEMNLYAISRYTDAGADGYFWCDDWGLQDRLMVAPDSWRKIWKPRYARIFQAAHDAGMLTFLHSCGYIVDILDDLIEIGLDVIQMDQQENMGLELLGERFSGRITFWCPVDIQKTMARGNPDEIRAYCHRMVSSLGTSTGGFMAVWYSNPVAAGHTQEAVDAMCSEIARISEERARQQV